MSSTFSSASPAMTSSVTSVNNTLGTGQQTQGISLVALLTALATSAIIFGVQFFAFILLKDQIARIYKPKTYLVPERERTEPPPTNLFGWMWAIFRFPDREIIKKCGLDAYFFLRYLQTLLLIFVPMACVILPILVPLNSIGGRGNAYALEFGNSSSSSNANVTGLDTLAWGNVRPNKTRRYWGHLALALVTIIWVCAIFFVELRVYIKVRQDYLTSAEHRLRASATTVLVSAIPRKWLSTEALAGLYDVFPGGIRNIWINRNFDELLDKIKERDKVFKKLEAAETQLVKDAMEAQKKQVAKDEKAARKQGKARALTKEEKAAMSEAENAEAERRAGSEGVTSGDLHQVPHTIDDAIDEEQEQEERDQAAGQHADNHQKSRFKIPGMDGIAAVGQGIGKGLDNALGGALNVGKDINSQLGMTNGFVNFDGNSPVIDDDHFDAYGRYRDPALEAKKAEIEKAAKRDSIQESAASFDGPLAGVGVPGNAVRKRASTLDPQDGFAQSTWWKFWEGPSGGFISPIPTGWDEGDEYPFTKGNKGKDGKESKGLWGSITGIFGDSGVVHVEYPVSYNEEYREDASHAAWEKYLKKKDRPSHRLQPTGTGWMPNWLMPPLITKKVDTIYWCRGELARLNMEIEMDQKHPERFPFMNSAFIQFNHQVAAHMVCQSVTHHVPMHMAPRTVEIAPGDVIWENMSMKWWESWFRTGIVTITVAGMIILWAFPVAWTASLAQISTLSHKYHWLHWLDKIPNKWLNAIEGVLPALVLAILLAVVPKILGYLSFIQGAKTGTEKQGSVQNYYFFFLFVQVFLVVSISGGAIATLGSSASDITAVPDTLATQLPKASNYFFSYMILQAMSTSSATLLQVVTLFLFYILSAVTDKTARQKWRRNTKLQNINWGSFFPVYTNFACISLIYSVVAPVIIIFAIITFTLLWVANRYNMLYVTRFRVDTGGLVYPRAINQTFTGLYVMELCLIGLFFLVRDDDNKPACVSQAIIMIISMFLTMLYQFLLNMAFSPLFRHLPITFEDEAVIRDEIFERAQARRLGLDVHDDESSSLRRRNTGGDIELDNLGKDSLETKRSKLNPVKLAHGAGSWAVKSSHAIRSKTFGNPAGRALARHKKRDVEEQQRMGDALYGGYNDEIEDLTPDERDVLVRHAFQHYALRARRPVIWIPQDTIGVSTDEIKRTRDFAGNNIWITNRGAALDSKCKVVYGKNPPDFSEVDLINL